MVSLSSFHPVLALEQIAELTRLLGEIDEFKGHWRKLGEIRAERLASLRQVTTIESAGSSTRIEGAQLSDEEVARVLQGLQVDSFRARDEAEVKGYAQLLQAVFDHHADIPLTENHLKQLHQILLRHVEKDEWHRGTYKKLDNHVEAQHPDGTKTIVFRTASPFDTPRLMAELVATTNAAFDSDAFHPLVVIARFIIEFLAIHPFQDGNGRLSRAVTALLMLRSGYEYVPYASVERIIEENTLEYYRALRVSQTEMQQDTSRFGDWLLFFLRVLQAQKRILSGKLETERAIVRLKDVQVRALELVERHGRVTTGEVAEALKLGYRAARYHLGLLVERGLIQAHGERRGRYYTRPTGSPTDRQSSEQSVNAAILASIFERGGSVTQAELRALIDQHGADRRLIGSMHGRRKAHLRRDPQSRRSMLTPRGREIAEQYLFTRRLTERLGAAGETPQPTEGRPLPRAGRS
ncbi:MAG: Fic family protein [Gemmatimonadetes bacterium]|nr:Fic family protein [Gemmatimonadota bacterium]